MNERNLSCDLIGSFGGDLPNTIHFRAAESKKDGVL